MIAETRPQLFKNWIILFTMQCSQHILFYAFGKITAKAIDSYTFTFIVYKIHLTILSFAYIFHLLDSSLSSG